MALLPLLAAKQRPVDANDWMATDTEVACPDPHCSTRLRITLNGLRQAMDSRNANAPALARAAQVELDAYVRSVGAAEPDVDAIRLALEAVAKID